MGSFGGVGVKLFALSGVFWWLAQGLAVEGEAVGGVHEAVEDGIARLNELGRTSCVPSRQSNRNMHAGIPKNQLSWARRNVRRC